MYWSILWFYLYFQRSFLHATSPFLLVVPFNGLLPHYSNIKWPSWRHELPVNRCLFNSFCRLSTKKHKKSAFTVLLLGHHRWPPVDSAHKETVTRKIFPFDDVIMDYDIITQQSKTWIHYNDAIMSAIASQITSFTNVYSTVHSCADQRKHQSSASLAFVRGIHRRPVNSPHKWLVTRKIFPFDDVIMYLNKR